MELYQGSEDEEVDDESEQERGEAELNEAQAELCYEDDGVGAGSEKGLKGGAG